MTTAEHKQVVEQLRIEKDAIVARFIEAQRLYAESIAADIGLKIGSVVSVASRQGHGLKKKTVTKRYRVTYIALCDWREHGLRLRGTMIRKDGTDGESHAISGEWTLESEESQ